MAIAGHAADFEAAVEVGDGEVFIRAGRQLEQAVGALPVVGADPGARERGAFGVHQPSDERGWQPRFEDERSGGPRAQAQAEGPPLEGRLVAVAPGDFELLQVCGEVELEGAEEVGEPATHAFAAADAPPQLYG